MQTPNSDWSQIAQRITYIIKHYNLDQNMVQNIFRNFLAVDFVLSVGPKMIFIKKGISLGN